MDVELERARLEHLRFAVATELEARATIEARFLERGHDWKLSLGNRYANQYAATGDLALIDQLRVFQSELIDDTLQLIATVKHAKAPASSACLRQLPPLAGPNTTIGGGYSPWLASPGNSASIEPVAMTMSSSLEPSCAVSIAA